MTDRRKSRVTHVGRVLIGGENPIAVQSMTDTDTADVKAKPFPGAQGPPVR